MGAKNWVWTAVSLPKALQFYINMLLWEINRTPNKIQKGLKIYAFPFLKQFLLPSFERVLNTVV